MIFPPEFDDFTTVETQTSFCNQSHLTRIFTVVKEEGKE